ncbi:MAG: iron ABC transporter permease [Candidatus Methanomethylophilaceae archaeon]|nr:iron ABC transporter permease [Candidatus Methanomethylophilaceae archaeon]
MMDGRYAFKRDYNAIRKRKMLFVGGCILVAFVAMGLQLSVGKYDITFLESYGILFDHIMGVDPVTDLDAKKDYVVWDLRFPRALASLAVGAGLGVCGAAMQSTLRNPLADPYTTGISAGAGLGACLALVSGVCVVPFLYGEAATVVNAFVFSLIPAFVIIGISAVKKKVTSSMMILIGIAVMYVFTAFTTLLKLTASDESLEDVYMWNVGLLGKASWDNVWVMLLFALIGIVLFQYLSGRLNILTMSDGGARSLGVDPKRERLIVLVIVSLVTSVMVAFTGTIGFVGLVAPHMVRMFLGSDNRFLIPASAAFGAMLLICTDCLAKNIGVAGLPVGVVTACIGGPLFLYLLLKQRKAIWN